MTSTNLTTTIGGILGAIGSAGVGIEAVPPNYKWIFAVCSAAGLILLGYAAKGKDEHSTADQVAHATAAEKEIK